MTAPTLAAVALAATVAIVALRCRPSSARMRAAGIRAEPSARGGVVAAISTRLHRVTPIRRAVPKPQAVGDWCDDLARHLRSGASLHDALVTVMPADTQTIRATDGLRLRLGRGATVVEAAQSPTDVGVSLRLALDVIGITARLGGSAAAAIDRTGSTLRQRAADQDERVVQAAQARLSAHVLTAVPLAMLALLLAFDGDIGAAVTTPIGSLCLVLGLALNAAGWTWMRHIVAVTW